MLKVVKVRPWRVLFAQKIPRNTRNIHTPSPQTITVLGETYPTDDYTNLPPTIAALLARRLHVTPPHPLNTIRKLIAGHFEGFKCYDNLPAVVTPELNFDSLGFPPDHPGRERGQSYYINRGVMLRTHTSAHEVDIYRETPKSGGWLCTADVYRRDEIDRSHYPAFHQTEGARLVNLVDMDKLRAENDELRRRIADSKIIMKDCLDFDPVTNPLQSSHLPETVLPMAQNLKLRITTLFLSIFPPSSDPLHVRWTPDIFPWTSPSFQLEVRYRDAWLELLGCGIVLDATIARTGHNPVDERSWAFGMGLERIAMPLFGVPDIRLFWSQDERFWKQFKDGQLSTFQEFSKYPLSERDVAFWLPLGEVGGWEENDLWDIIREVGGDLVEDVKLIDDFWHEGNGRRSLAVRITFRSMERSVERAEVNKVTDDIKAALTARLAVEIR
ncbi:phenylalanyl-tRNA synthetase [Dacryopinax primogenitus]|uniref:phenylalanine--tRNA ligase n=1 Tax=Dacryopinax primogenitus (strain DJM 731) TaxID=1858805 RepID=M5FT86_DACPD|nr:phenylalanyl-tRNA synthetase [Dacryopinax primogenitus]EJU00816.1 phenylalanyl-tRNA synthetase [Dacryopinax primogenitus]